MESDLGNSDENGESFGQDSFKDLFSNGAGEVSWINDAAREKTDLLAEIFPSKPVPKESQPRKRGKFVEKTILGTVRRSGRILSIQRNANSNCGEEPTSGCTESSSSTQPTGIATSTSTPEYALSSSSITPANPATSTSTTVHAMLSGSIIPTNPAISTSTQVALLSSKPSGSAARTCTSSLGSMNSLSSSGLLVSTLYNSGTESDEADNTSENLNMSQSIRTPRNYMVNLNNQSFRTPQRRNYLVSESFPTNTSAICVSPNRNSDRTASSPTLSSTAVSPVHHTSHSESLDRTVSTVRYESRDEDTDSSSNKENVNPTVSAKKRRKAKKIRDKFGERITEFNAMPTFGEALHSELIDGTIDRKALNKAVKFHLRKIKKKQELYLSSNEWHLVCSKLIKKYLVLADVDSPESYVQTTKFNNI